MNLYLLRPVNTLSKIIVGVFLLHFFTITGCDKSDDGPSAPVNDSLVVTLLNNTPNTSYDAVRLMIYESEAAYQTPFAKPLFDTVFNKVYPGKDKATAQMFSQIFTGVKPGSYWAKLISTDGVKGSNLYSNIFLSNQKFEVEKNKTTHIKLDAKHSKLKTFVINKLTVHSTSQVLSLIENPTVRLMEIWDNAYAFREPNKILISSKISRINLPFTIENLNIRLYGLPTWWYHPRFYISFQEDANNETELMFIDSIKKSGTLGNKIFVWNKNKELAFTLEGSWIVE